MTIESLKKQVIAAVAPMEAAVNKRDEYGRVEVKLSNKSIIAGYFRLDGDIDVADIVAQSKAAEAEAKVNTCFVFAGTTIVDKAFGPQFFGHDAQTTCESLVLPAGITEIGEEAFKECRFKSITIPEGVTKIYRSAFEECKQLQEVVLPQSLTELGGKSETSNVWSDSSDVFKCCTALQSITLPQGLTTIVSAYMFRGCTALQSVTLPQGLTEIGESMFSGCSALTSVNIPESVTEIGSNAFEDTALASVTLPEGVTKIDYKVFAGCGALTRVNIPESVTEIGSYAFDGTALASVTLPEGVAKIGNGVFRKCAALASVTLPESLAEVGTEVFKGCTALQDYSFENGRFVFADGLLIDKVAHVLLQNLRPDRSELCVPEGVSVIGRNVFAECKTLQSVSLPSTLTTIGKEAFKACDKLTSIDMPQSVTVIGDEAFCECSALQDVTLPAGLTELGENAFLETALQSVVLPDGLKKISGTFSKCKSLTSVTLPAGLTEVGYCAFDGCEQLQSVTLPEGLTTIDNSAFRGCTALQNLRLPESVTSIGRYAFKSCNAFTEVTLPAAVTEVGDSAFGYCSALQRVAIENKDIKIDTDAFWNCPLLDTVDLPKGLSWSKLKNKFKKTPWGENGPADSKTAERKAKKEAEKAKEEKLGAIRDMSLEAMAKAKFAPYETSVRVGDTEMTFTVSLPNDSFIRGCFAIDKAKDFNQIDWNALQALKAKAESTADTLFVAGDKVTGCDVARGIVKHVVIDENITELNGSLKYFALAEDVALPSKLQVIEGFAFKGWESLKSINIPDGVCSIGSYTFKDCKALCKVTIPDSVTSIDTSAFSGCPKASFDSLHYSLADGFFVNKDTKTLLKYTGNALEVTVPDGIEVIGYEAFEKNTTLQSVTLPASVKSVETLIDQYNDHAAFQGCTALQTVVIGDPYINIDLKAFLGCTAITHVDLPAGLTWTKIKNRFKECPWGQTKPAEPAKKAAPKAKTAGGKAEKDLRSMTITAAVKYIFEPYEVNVTIEKFEYGWKKTGYHLSVIVPLPNNSTIYGRFGNAEGKPFTDRKITVDQIDIESLKAIKLRAEQEQPSDTVYNVGNASSHNQLYEIVNTTQAKQLIICPAATRIWCDNSTTLERVVVEGGNPEFSFKGCTALKDVQLPESLTCIEYSAFEGCTALESIDLPKSVTKISWNAFEGCTALKTVNMPGVTEISLEAFKDCTALAVTLPVSLERIRYNAFAGLDLDECEFENEHFVMKGGLLIDKAENELVLLYAHAKTVTSVTIPEGVTAIGSNVFFECATLTSITLPESLQKIGNQTFQKTALLSVVIPEAVTEIESSAFFGCTSLKKVVIQNPNTTLGEGAFAECSALTEVELPKGMSWSKVKKYFKGSPWSEEKPKK